MLETKEKANLLIVLNGIETSIYLFSFKNPFLLIVLNGIETRNGKKNLLARYALLIVLNGIETISFAYSWFCAALLIVLNGIETFVVLN